MAAERMSGTVKWFSRVKGYGFIAPDGEEREIFVHFTGIEGEGYRNLEKGEKVSFVIEDTDKGPQAVNVRAEGFDVTSWTAEPTDEDETSWRADEEETAEADAESADEPEEETAESDVETADEPVEEAVESDAETADELEEEEPADFGGEEGISDESGEEAEPVDSEPESTEELEQEGTEPPDLVA